MKKKKGITCNSPKDCFREAYHQKLIEYDDVWMKFVDMRNETVHTYKEEIADKIYAELPEVLKLLKELLTALKEP